MWECRAIRRQLDDVQIKISHDPLEEYHDSIGQSASLEELTIGPEDFQIAVSTHKVGSVFNEASDILMNFIPSPPGITATGSGALMGYGLSQLCDSTNFVTTGKCH